MNAETPVRAAGSNRIVTLDIVRGVAVMGIFSVNVVAFAMIEVAYFNPAAYGGHSGIDLAMWVANLIVIDGKMRSLFSMLFGASMLLVIERAAAKGESPARVHFARMAVLLAIGLIHYHLLWWGDILHLYAVIGMIAFLFRDKPVGALMRWGIGLMLFAIAIYLSVAAATWQADVAAHAPGASRDAIKQWNELGGTFYPSAQKIAEDIALHRGSWWGIARHYLVDKAFEWVSGVIVLGPETLALMLFGMAGYRSAFLSGGWDDRRYRRIALVCLSLGALASILLAIVEISTRFYVPVIFAGFMGWMAPFRPVMAAGYAALIILLTRERGWIADRIAAVGRTAFSNYILMSLVGCLVFYGWGFGLYGSVSRAESWLLVPLVWLFMLVWSKPWLERFHYGPFEWLWRSLARGELQPMRRRPGGRAAAEA